MAVQLKPIAGQVVVITGATSGIGLATARLAAERGASLVLAARGDEALRQLVDEIQGRGGQAISVVTDVSKQDQVRRLGEAAVEHFGRIDSWVNDAGVTIYGELNEVPIEDQRQLFETNYWGVVYGSLEAVRHLRERGGALINLGSIMSDMSAPLQAQYVASKHAIKGFTNSLRMELQHEGLPVSVTLIKPAAIDTPFPEHGRNYMQKDPMLPPPVYPPRLVARAILRACEVPTRELVVGGAGWAQKVMYQLAPTMSEGLYASNAGYSLQMTSQRADPSRRDNLHAPKRGLAERSSYKVPLMPVSPFTEMQLHPVLAFGAAAALGVALLGLTGGRRRPSAYEAEAPGRYAEPFADDDVEVTIRETSTVVLIEPDLDLAPDAIEGRSVGTSRLRS